MNKLLSTDRLYISKSKTPNAGRGVFAKVDIKKGEIIERCPVLEIPADDASSINQTMLVTYVYYLGPEKEYLTLALGFGSIYNHSYNPNSKYKHKLKEGVIEFIALRDIKSEEEITVNYNQGNDNKNPLWFE